MSYGDASLDMSSLSIACLCGQNGAGKSAILDAITWALWESARSSSDELVRMGQQEMWVDLTFELEDNFYRVRRSRYLSPPRTASKVSKGTLDFQVWKAESQVAPAEVGARPRTTQRANKTAEKMPQPGPSPVTSATGTWGALNGASMRETQTRICEILRMDYDTFINSVYLRQGRADEFTTRPPSERKHVLSEILGLSRFDQLSELARDESRSRKAEIEYLQAGMEDVPQLAEELQSAQSEEARLIQLLQKTRSDFEGQKLSLQMLDQQLIELNDIRSRLEPTQLRLTEIDADMAHLQPTLDRLTTRKVELDALLAAVPGMQEILSRFNVVKSTVGELDTIALQRQGFETRRLELRSKLATQRGRLEVELEHLQSQMETLKEQQERLMKLAAEREKLQTDFGAYKRLVAQEAEMSKRQEAYTQLSARAEQLHTTVVESRLRLEAELNQQKESHTELLSLLTSKDELSREGEGLHCRAGQLEQLEIEFDSVEESGIRMKQEIDLLDQSIQILEKQTGENDHKCRELTEPQTLTMCPLCAAPIVDRAAVLDRYGDLNKQIRQEIADCETKKQNLEEKRGELRKRYIELKRELESRKRLDVQIGEFNGRMAAVARAETSCQRIADQVIDLERKLQAQDYAQVERESLVNIKAEMHKLEFDPVIFSNLQAQLRMQRNVEMRYQQFKRDQAELARLNEQIPLLEQSMGFLKTQLVSSSFAQHDSTELTEVEAKLGEFTYDRAEHDDARNELAKLLPLVDKMRDFDRVSTEKPEVDAQLENVTTQIKLKRGQYDALAESITEWSVRIESFPILVQRKAELHSTLSELDESKQLSERQLAVLEKRIEQLQTQQETLQNKQNRLNALLVEMNDYQFLSESFGKKGIQAIIIENAVPELEGEANEILARLTDNQMHIGLVTQQKTKQGSIQETLDILIADNLGTRNYELYSGGEAFKINFAIRVALSRLLARRAGAKLQTLIIDEGFGSQDEDSRGRLMQAINSIRGDFARIIVVTHIAEIKEMFPVQILVQKQSGLSEVTVLHN